MGLRVEPENFESATVFFSDIVQFTVICSKSTPSQVVDMMNYINSVFDSYIDKFHCYKVWDTNTIRLVG
jgi:class 3 adenylate cyclase